MKILFSEEDWKIVEKEKRLYNEYLDWKHEK